MNRRFFAFVLACAYAQASWARSTEVESIKAQLKTSAVVRGDFEQRKTLQGFKHPLLSKGQFLIARGQGLQWQTKEPFASSLIITPTQLLSRQADGQINNRIQAKDEPGIRAINELLVALISVDWPVLQQRFTMQAKTKSPDGWYLQLTPLEPQLAKWVRQIELSGDAYVRQVTIAEAQGDVSHITLSHQTTADVLNAQDALIFR